VRGDIEAVASVPFCLEVEEGNGGGNAGDGDTPYQMSWTFSSAILFLRNSTTKSTKDTKGASRFPLHS
jgi:hypothetical protein